MKNKLSRILVFVLINTLILGVAIATSNCSAADKASCKYKVAQKKKEIRSKQRITIVPYYARKHR